MHHDINIVLNAANQALATLAFFGVGVNLVLFLTRVLRQDSAEAANNVSKWTGTVYIFSLIGAFLSDSYLIRFSFNLLPSDRKTKGGVLCVNAK